MIIGIPPFYDKNSNKMFLNIESSPIRWPHATKHGISVSEEAKDLITKVGIIKLIKIQLLDRNRMTRLGAKKDVDEILRHPFFKDLDLEKLSLKILESPFIPQIMDVEKLRQQSGDLVSFKDFQETIIPRQGMELVNKQKEEFEIFGEVKEAQTPVAQKEETK